MTALPRPAVALVLALAAAGCASIDNPAGLAAGGGFGDAIARNHQILTGEGTLTHMDARFAAEVTPTVTFDFDSAVLTPAARAVLDRQAAWMRQFPELAFSLYGHADAPGSNAYNRDLGERRARAVLGYLAARGIDRRRLAALVSFGETRPAIPGAGRERANRRVVTQVSGFGEPGNPAPLNGKYAEVVFREYIEAAVPTPAQSQQSTVGIDIEE